MIRVAILLTIVLFTASTFGACRYEFDSTGDQMIVCDDGTSGPTGCHLESGGGISTVRCDVPDGVRKCYEGTNAEGEPTAICTGLLDRLSHFQLTSIIRSCSCPSNHLGVGCYISCDEEQNQRPECDCGGEILVPECRCE